MDNSLATLLLGLILIIISARLGALLAKALKQPEVLGEIVAGVLIGNLCFLSPGLLESNQTIILLSEIGVIILLFQVGLESNLKQMLSLGWISFFVALVGILVPFGLAYFCADWILPNLSQIQKIFLGSILTATSVGITARTFKDLNFLKQKESQIVLGAAVIDDILGLIILAITTGLAQSGLINLGSIGMISLKAFGFLFLAIFVGQKLSPQILKLLAKFELDGLILSFSLSFCFLLAYLSHCAGLASIVGAFCAGLVLDQIHFKNFKDKSSVEDYLKPIGYFLIPIFFVMTGAMVNLNVFQDPQTLIAGLSITAIAIIGKLASGLCLIGNKETNKWIVGVGMIPRGEVGLIFASVGKGLGIINDQIYAVTIIMVLVTTLLTPPILKQIIKNAK